MLSVIIGSGGRSGSGVAIESRLLAIAGSGLLAATGSGGRATSGSDSSTSGSEACAISGSAMCSATGSGTAGLAGSDCGSGSGSAAAGGGGGARTPNQELLGGVRHLEFRRTRAPAARCLRQFPRESHHRRNRRGSHHPRNHRMARRGRHRPSRSSRRYRTTARPPRSRRPAVWARGLRARAAPPPRSRAHPRQSPTRVRAPGSNPRTVVAVARSATSRGRAEQLRRRERKVLEPSPARARRRGRRRTGGRPHLRLASRGLHPLELLPGLIVAAVDGKQCVQPPLGLVQSNKRSVISASALIAIHFRHRG